jgi:hypothetical protein
MAIVPTGVAGQTCSGRIRCRGSAAYACHRRARGPRFGRISQVRYAGGLWPAGRGTWQRGRRGAKRAYPSPPPAAFTSVRMAALICSGRWCHAVTTRARSGWSNPRCKPLGTTVGTSASGVSRNSLTGLDVARSRLRPPEPKVTGSNPVGDTFHTPVSISAEWRNLRAWVANRALSLARVAAWDNSRRLVG